MDNKFWQTLLEPDVLGILFVTVCVITGVVSVTTLAIVKMLHKHNERIAMIEHGINPDYPHENQEEIQNPPSTI
jgi:hypothetical protein